MGEFDLKSLYIAITRGWLVDSWVQAGYRLAIGWLQASNRLAIG